MPNIQLHPEFLRDKPWMDFPTFAALDPDNPNQILTMRVAGTVLLQQFQSLQRTKIWEAWAHFINDLPPIRNANFIRSSLIPDGFGSLLRPEACFRGLKRPHNEERNGDSVMVHIVAPSQTLVFQPGMVCAAKAVHVPASTVLAVYSIATDSLQIRGKSIDRAVIGWEFIPADSDSARMPFDFGGRYDEEIWRK